MIKDRHKCHRWPKTLPELQCQLLWWAASRQCHQEYVSSPASHLGPQRQKMNNLVTFIRDLLPDFWKKQKKKNSSVGLFFQHKIKAAPWLYWESCREPDRKGLLQMEITRWSKQRQLCLVGFSTTRPFGSRSMGSHYDWSSFIFQKEIIYGLTEWVCSQLMSAYIYMRVQNLSYFEATEGLLLGTFYWRQKQHVRRRETIGMKDHSLN